MRILFACHRFPYPPIRGGKIRPFNIIRHLSESGYSVTVGSLVRSEEEQIEGEGLKDYCQKVLIGRVSESAATARMIARLPTTVPSSIGYFYSPSLHRAVKQELEQSDYDLLFVHCSSAAQYVKHANGIPSILDFGDMDSQKWFDYGSFRRFPLSVGYRLEASKLLREEKRLARHFDVSTCTTRAELETLRSYDAARKTDWFPNGVDNEFFSPDNDAYDPNLIVFIGRMDYFPNRQAMLLFCDEILPHIASERPATRLKIVGAEPSKEIRRLAERPGIEVTGTVADVREHVRPAAVSVAPLAIARGTQNKILESMAMGVPVVCSDVASGGVDAEPGRHLVVASSARDYADVVLRILEDPAMRTRLATEGRERVVLRHDWRASMRKLDSIIASATGEEG